MAVKRSTKNQTKKGFSVRLDIKGEQYGRLLVGKFVGKNKHGQVLWECQCQCGNVIVTSTNQLRQNKTKSCGCLERDLLVARNKSRQVHGEGAYKEPEYISYMAAKYRCENKNCAYFQRYGGRGIKLLMTYKEMIEHIGRKPTKHHSLDRIDVNGHYEKGNIRWANNTQQSRNQRRNKLAGVQQRKSGRWRAYIGVDKKVKHLGTFDTKEEALKAREVAMEKYWYGNI